MFAHLTPFNAAILVSLASMSALVLSYLTARVVMARAFLLDQPNLRSSHTQVTPRSGGLAIITGWFAGMVLLIAFAKSAEHSLVIFKFCSLGVLAFLIGLADDRFKLSPVLKFSGQIAVAVLFVWLMGALAAFPVPFLGSVSLGWLGPLVTVLWIVGLMNAFNFMDGVNGIAGVVASLVLCALIAAGIASDQALVAGDGYHACFFRCRLFAIKFSSGENFHGRWRQSFFKFFDCRTCRHGGQRIGRNGQSFVCAGRNSSLPIRRRLYALPSLEPR